MFSFAAPRVLAAVLAVSPSPSPSPGLPPQIAHVVTSDRSDETLHNAVRTTYVVTAAQIAREGYRTVAQALERIPGVELQSYGPIGSSAGYGIRGSSSAQVLVLVDGQPAPGTLANSVELGTMSTAGVSRIEVVEGGGSTLYGTGAVGGIINIITDDRHAAATAMLRYGSFDDRELQVQAGGLSLERIVATNAYGLPPSGSGNPAVRNDSDYEATSARYGLDRRVGAIGFSLHTALESDDLGVVGFFPYYSPNSREHDVNEDGVLTLSLQRPGSTASLTFDGARQLTTYDGALNTEVRSGVSLRDVVAGNGQRSIYGIDLSRGIVRGDDGAGGISTDALAQSAVYTQHTWIGARDEFYAGLRGERDGALGGEFSPSAGARFDLSRAFELKFNAADAFRAPNASELYFPGYGSVAQGLGALRPERAQVGDVTLTDRRALGGLSLGWFDNDTRDMIVSTCIRDCNVAANPPNTYPDYAPENVDRAHIEGLTFEAQTLARHGVTATLEATDLYLAQDLVAQTRLPNDPAISLGAGIRWRSARPSLLTELGISERLVGARGAVDPTQPAFFQAVPYASLDAYARLRISRRARLTLRGSNLGNERYADVAGYPLPGRTFAIELSSR